MRKHISQFGSFVLASTLVAACSAAPDGEVTGSTEGALTPADSQAFTISATQYNGIALLAQVSASTLQSANGQITFTPSPAITSMLWPQSPSPSVHAISAPLPSLSMDMPDPLGAYTVTVTSFAMTDVSTDLQTADAHVHADFTGNLHFSSANILQPNFDIALSNIAVDVFVGVSGTAPVSTPASPSNGQLKLDALNVTATTQVQNCFDGLCNGFIQGQMPNVAAVLRNAMMPPLQAAVTGPTAYSGFLSALSSYATLQSSGVRGWTIAGSPTLSNTTIAFEMVGLPAAPTGCVATTACASAYGGLVSVTCNPDATADAVHLEQQSTAPGVWYPVPANPYGLKIPGLVAMADVSEVLTFRVCAADASGQSCSTPIVITTPDTLWCGGGGGGGGSSSSGGNGKPCGGKVCVQ